MSDGFMLAHFHGCGCLRPIWMVGYGPGWCAGALACIQHEVCVYWHLARLHACLLPLATCEASMLALYATLNAFVDLCVVCP